VTRHEKRAQRGETAHALHQRYLRQQVDRLGSIRLSQINPNQLDGVPLENVYVDSPVDVYLSVEVKDWHVVDWWISSGREAAAMRDLPGGQAKPESADVRTRAEALGYERAALEALIPLIEDEIDEYRKRWPNQETTDVINSWNNGPHDNVHRLILQDVAAACDRLVVLGAPGSGKSTFARHLALCLAGAQTDGWSRPATLNRLGHWPHGKLTPIYVELARFVASSQYPAGDEKPSAQHLWAYIEQAVLGPDLADYAPDLRQDLEEGHAVLILDGLDEVPYEQGKLVDRQRELQNLAVSLNAQYEQSRVIVASRPYAYEGWALPGFNAVTIADFADEHRIALATNLYKEAGQTEEESTAKARRLNDELAAVSAELKDRPLFLTLMATIFLENEGEGLPTRKGALYRRSILLLMQQWTQRKRGAPALQNILGLATPDDLYARLAVLACEIHARHREVRELPLISRRELAGYLMEMAMEQPGVDPLELFRYLNKNAGLLVSPGQKDGQDVYHFAHRSFQEYLAASHLVVQCRADDSFDRVRDLIQSQPQIWREPCKLVGDVLVDEDRRSELWYSDR
jgi:energy-coupling factor transporter ATP-binding protein EcfA2